MFVCCMCVCMYSLLNDESFSQEGVTFLPCAYNMLGATLGPGIYWRKQTNQIPAFTLLTEIQTRGIHEPCPHRS